MSSKLLSVSVTDDIATVLLNRPPVNAFDGEQLDRLERVLDEIRRRKDIRLVILRGAGRHFCAGADIKPMASAVETHDMARMNGFVARIQALFNEWAELDIPTLAVIQGAATGGGLEIALACDLRIATTSARFALPEVTLGLVPAGGGTQRLTALIGRGAALRMMLTGEAVDGRKALALGLVQWCVDDDHVDATVDAIAAQITSASLPAQRLIKRCVGLTGTAAGFPAEPVAQRILHSNADTLRRLVGFTRRGAADTKADSATGEV